MFKFVLFVTIFVFVIHKSSSDYKTRSFKCTTSNRTVSTGFKCFAKSYSRAVSIINLLVNFTRPVYAAKVSIFVRIKWW